MNVGGGGSGCNLGEVSRTFESNGPYTIYPKEGDDGISQANVIVNVPQPRLEYNRYYELQSINTEEQIFPSEGYDAMASCMVVFDGSSRMGRLELTLNSNSFYSGNVPVGQFGWNSYRIRVNVPNESSPILNIEEPIERYVHATDVPQTLIYEPSEGYDALSKVTVYLSSAGVIKDTNILNLTSNGTFPLPSLSGGDNYGFAPSCTVTVDVPNKIQVKYISLSNPASAMGTIDLSSVSFNVYENDSFELRPGYTLFICTDLTNVSTTNYGYNYIVYGNPSTNSNSIRYTHSLSGNWLYYIFNYDIGNWVYLMDENQNRIFQMHTYDTGDGGKKTSHEIIRSEHFSIPTQLTV